MTIKDLILLSIPEPKGCSKVDVLFYGNGRGRINYYVGGEIYIISYYFTYDDYHVQVLNDQGLVKILTRNVVRELENTLSH